jgi:hypothetical protein
VCSSDLNKQKEINIKYEILQKFFKAFKYPFSFINMDKNNKNYMDTYNVKNIAHIMFNKNMKKEKINLDKFYFPNNIIYVYWYEEGENDIKPWQFIGITSYKNKVKYVYFIAEADYTGFDCKGMMKLYISKSLKRLIKKAIPKDILEKHNIKFYV